jgi:hypothetical protein
MKDKNKEKTEKYNVIEQEMYSIKLHVTKLSNNPMYVM